MIPFTLKCNFDFRVTGPLGLHIQMTQGGEQINHSKSKGEYVNKNMNFTRVRIEKVVKQRDSDNWKSQKTSEVKRNKVPINSAKGQTQTFSAHIQV